MRFEWAADAFRSHSGTAHESLAELYHENSKLWAEAARQQQAAQFSMSDFELYLTSRGFRQYRNARKVALPDVLPSRESLSDIMRRRRSSRDLSGALRLDELSTVLRQSLGPTAVLESKEKNVSQVFRAWPSAGGLYPCDAYVVARNVLELAPGLYHYNLVTSELEQLPSRSPELIIQDGFFWQEFMNTASAVLLLVAVFERTIAKYGARGYRLVLLDAGHAAQCVLLTAEQLRMGAVAVAGFCDDSLASDLNIDGVTEAVIHSVALGKSDDRSSSSQG